MASLRLIAITLAVIVAFMLSTAFLSFSGADRTTPVPEQGARLSAPPGLVGMPLAGSAKKQAQAQRSAP